MDYATSEEWEWTMMIMQPDFITSEMFADALAQVRKKRDNPYLDKLRMSDFREGLSIQILHVGPYADEQRTLEKMAVFAAEHGYSFQGKHHEIYLGDPRRTKPENLTYGEGRRITDSELNTLNNAFKHAKSEHQVPVEEFATKPENLKTVLRQPVVREPS